MPDWIQFIGPEHALQVFGVRLVGVNAIVGKKALLSLAVVAFFLVVSYLLARATARLQKINRSVGFWSRQAVRVVVTTLVILVLGSVWFDDPGRLSAALGLITAGVAFALQKVITSLAAYIVILRGNTFSVGERIMMGGVRGDVIGLSFIQTKILEMGQAPGEQNDDPSMWVHSRQYTGRVVTVTNDRIFETPVYNYTREFPFIWEEMRLPVSYRDDRSKVEQILLEVAERNIAPIRKLGERDLEELERRFALKPIEAGPRVYWRMTDNWMELTLRFIAPAHGIRELKDKMTREIIAALDKAKIGVASTTFEIVGLPRLYVRQVPTEVKRE